MTPTNEERAQRMELTARYYCTLVGQNYEADGPDTAMMDILADLLHWCDRHLESFDELLRIASDHHSCERAEAAEEETQNAPLST